MRRERATSTVLCGTDVMPFPQSTHDICHACGRRGRFDILYMPMDSSAPATNSSKPASATGTERRADRADPWLTISAWIWAAYFIGLAAATVALVF
jgi:hypothetical protein